MRHGVQRPLLCRSTDLDGTPSWRQAIGDLSDPIGKEYLSRTDAGNQEEAVNELVELFHWGVVPSFVRRGGCAVTKCREASLATQPGWSLWTMFPERLSEHTAEATTPSAPSKEASQHLLEVASTPPHRGGDCPRSTASNSFTRSTRNVRRGYQLYFRIVPVTPSGEHLNGSIFKSEGEYSVAARGNACLKNSGSVISTSTTSRCLAIST
jgi:hypothetical protein